jgi:WD40 repeat protein
MMAGSLISPMKRAYDWLYLRVKFVLKNRQSRLVKPIQFLPAMTNANHIVHVGIHSMKQTTTHTWFRLTCILFLFTALLSACAPTPVPPPPSATLPPTAEPSQTPTPAPTSTATPVPTAQPTGTSQPTSTPTAVSSPTLTSLPAALSVPLPAGALSITGKGQLQGMSVSPLGYLAVANPFGVIVYKTPELTPLWAREVPTGVLALAYSPDGKQLAGATADSVILWDAATSQQISTASLTVDDITYTTYGLTFAPDSSFVAGKDIIANVITWDLKSPKVTVSAPSHQIGGGGGPNMAFTTNMAISPDSSKLLFTVKNELVLWDYAKGEKVWSYSWGNTPANLGICGFSPDGETAFALNMYTDITLFDATNGQVMIKLPAPKAADAAYAPDGKTIYAPTDKQILAWTAAGVALPAPPVDSVEKIFFLDKTTSAAAKFSGKVSLFNILHGTEIAALNDFYNIYSARYLQDYKSIAMGLNDSFLLWDTTTNQLQKEIPALAISPDGSLALQVRTVVDKKMLVLYSIAKSKNLFEWPASPQYDSLPFAGAFSPDSKFLVTVSDGITFIDVEKAKVIRTLPALKDYAYPEFSPDGKLVAFTQGKSYILYDVTTQRQLKTIETQEDVYGLAFSPDGKTLAVATGGETIHLVDPQTGKDIAGFTVPGKAQSAAVFSPDGQTLATMDWMNNAIWLWDVTNAKFLGGFETPSSSLSFSPDGKTMAVAVGNGIVLYLNPAGPFQVKELPTQ